MGGGHDLFFLGFFLFVFKGFVFPKFVGTQDLLFLVHLQRFFFFVDNDGRVEVAQIEKGGRLWIAFHLHPAGFFHQRFFFDGLGFRVFIDQRLDEGSEVSLPSLLKIGPQGVGCFFIHLKGFHHELKLVTGGLLALNTQDGVGQLEGGLLFPAVLVVASQGP